MDATACVYDPGASFKSGLRWRFLDVPRMAVGQTGERVDCRKLADFLYRAAPDRVFVENVGPGGFKMRGRIQNNTSFIRAAAYCEATPAALGFPVTLVAPQKWKRHHKIKAIDEGDDAKEISRQLALRLLPELAPMLARKKDHGRAEAALLALYGEACLAPI